MGAGAGGSIFAIHISGRIGRVARVVVGLAVARVVVGFASFWAFIRKPRSQPAHSKKCLSQALGLGFRS